MFVSRGDLVGWDAGEPDIAGFMVCLTMSSYSTGTPIMSAISSFEYDVRTISLLLANADVFLTNMNGVFRVFSLRI